MIRPPDFSTGRLAIDGWSREPALADLRQILTPETLRTLPPSLQTNGSDAALRNWIIDRRAESLVSDIRPHGESRAIGFLILAPQPERRVLHLGYLLAQSAWGRGYATEVIAGLADALRAQAPLTVAAGVDQGNPASARVLEKAGFRPHANASHPETLHFTLSIDAPA